MKNQNAVYIVVIQQGCLLLIKKDNQWTLPGGLLDEADSNDEQCIKRWLEIQLPSMVIQSDSLTFFGMFADPPPYKDGITINVAIYNASLTGSIMPGDDIESVIWHAHPLNLHNLSMIAINVIKTCIEKNVLP